MAEVSLIEFGHLEDDYPILEIRLDGELAYEFVTKDGGGSVEILASGGERMLDGETVEAMLKLVLPNWRDAIKRRDVARGR